MKFNKTQKPVTKKIWSALDYLPFFIRKPLLRSKFQVTYDLSSDYVFKQADTEEEVEAALQIVYDSYSKLGYIDQRPEKVHFNKYLCLPTTAILVIKFKDEVIGTMSVLMDSSLGLPTETTWNLDHVKSKGRKVAEISSLCIKKGHKSSKGHLFLTFVKYLYAYCIHTLELDTIVMAATQEVEPFYTDVLLFTKVTGQTGQEHKLVKGNKSTCCYLNFKEGKALYQKEYGKKIKTRNLYHFLYEHQCGNFIFPEKKHSLHALLSKKNKAVVELLEKFPMLGQIFTPNEKLIISNLDPSTSIEKVISFDENSTTRQFPRINIINKEAHIYVPSENKMLKGQIREISKHGYSIRLDHDVKDLGKEMEVIMCLVFEDTPISVHSLVKWTSRSEAGFFVMEKSYLNWEKMARAIFNETNLSLGQERAKLRKVA